MDIHRLEAILKPRRVAVIGVGPNPMSVGGKILSNLVGGGFRGVVYPVSAAAEAVMGIPCYPRVADLPRVPDLGILCAPAARIPDLVRECGASGVGGLIIVSSGFRETGPEGRALEDEVRQTAAAFPSMRIVGPNCLGVIVPGHQLNASFAGAMPRPGQVAFISQSGALCTSVLDWALQEKVGFSHFLSIGNTLDVDFADLIDYLGEDEQTKSILLYVESIGRARAFMTAARAFARTKPIIAYKAGRFPASAEAAASHTGALAAEDAVYDAAFRRAGIARVFDFGEIFDVAELLGRKKVPRGDSLAILTNAGGPGVMAVDALVAAEGRPARLRKETMDLLNDILPPAWSHGNPVDVLGDAKSKLVAKAAGIILQDPGVDALLVIITPQAMTNPTAIAREIGALAATASAPILAAWMGAASMQEGVKLLNEAGIPTYATPEQGVRAFMNLVGYARNLEILYETPKDIPVEFSVDRKALRDRFESLTEGQGRVLSEESSKALLEAYGIPTARPVPAATAEDAVRAAELIGYPVVLKVRSPDITHKSDVGGVELDLRTPAAVAEAAHRILGRAAEARPDARIEGVTVQPMVRVEDGVEMILGAKRDPVFGTVLLAGLGGTAAELIGDRTLGFPPLNERLARRMLESLKMSPLLRGYRGRPALAVPKLIEAMIRLSYLVADTPEIAELDVNPLLVTADGILALDARVAVDSELRGRRPEPFAHLALRPYPEEYVRKVALPEGGECLLRPIKPEDEPLWMDLLSKCSRETIYQRFRGFFSWGRHDVAVRYCYIDYDRELAIVAEKEEDGRRVLMGVGRLAADPMKTAAEYAVLIGDPWQDQGLGGLLTDYCLEIARDWGVREVHAVTNTDNPRMVAVFQKRDFLLTHDPDGSVVEVRKTIQTK